MVMWSCFIFQDMGCRSRGKTTPIPIRAQRSNMPLVRRAPACAPRERADTRSAPTDAGILQLEIEFVSSVRKRIGINHRICKFLSGAESGERGRNSESLPLHGNMTISTTTEIDKPFPL